MANEIKKIWESKTLYGIILFFLGAGMQYYGIWGAEGVGVAGIGLALLGIRTGDKELGF